MTHKSSTPPAPLPEWSDGEGSAIETNRFKRAWRLGSLGAKITGSFIKDRIKQKISGNEDQTSALHQAAKRNASEMVRVMGQLKGAAMKLGQMMSSDPDLIDPAFAQELAKLQRHAPPMPFDQLKETVETRLQQPLEAIFSFFDPRPLGAASIGQVHHAILHDGREVAVKVQYPGIKDSLGSDLKNIENFLSLGRVVLSKDQIAGFMAELKCALEQEVDYLAEAQNLKDFQALFAQWDQVRIPTPLMDFCHPELLVMEFISGVPFHEGVSTIEDPEHRADLVKTFIKVFVYMFHDLHHLHVDPHPGNFLLDQQGRLVLLDFGCVREFDPQTSDQVLRCLSTFWGGDPHAQKQTLVEIGFGSDESNMPSADAIAEHHRLILAPMAHHEPFNFSKWSIHDQLRDFLKANLNFIYFAPPPKLILYFRVIAGIKGTLSQIDAEVNIREIAEECCVRRGIPVPL